MINMAKSVPSTGQTNWGPVLNEHLAQLNDPAKGGFNIVADNDARPSGLTANDEGLTVYNRANESIERWTGSEWEVLIFGGDLVNYFSALYKTGQGTISTNNTAVDAGTVVVFSQAGIVAQLGLAANHALKSGIEARTITGVNTTANTVTIDTAFPNSLTNADWEFLDEDLQIGSGVRISPTGIITAGSLNTRGSINTAGSINVAGSTASGTIFTNNIRWREFAVPYQHTVYQDNGTMYDIRCGAASFNGVPQFEFRCPAGGFSQESWLWSGHLGEYCRIHAQNPRLYVWGNIAASGSISGGSDIRWKKDITKIDSALEKISTLNGVTFNWNDDQKESRGEEREIGLIAQDVEKVFPEAVRDNEDGYKLLNYSGLIGPLVEAVKELKADNEALKARLNKAGL
jgi:hypothetical protein